MQPTDQRYCEASAGAVAANCDVCGGNTLISQKTPCRQRIVIRCGERILRGQSIGNGQGPQSSGATRLSHQATMTHDRTGTIAATMKKHQEAGGIAAGNDRPFPLHATEIDRSELYVP